ncbi:MAG: ThiF family adenylyltransferase [Planctomycetota bacterium]
MSIDNASEKPLLRPCRLVVHQRQFLQAARQLLADRTGFAIGKVRRRSTQRAEELLLDSWKTDASPPSGIELPPLMDWAVLAVANPDIPSIHALLESVQPKRSQLLVAILLVPENLDRFPAGIWQAGSLAYPSEVRMMGSRMLRLPMKTQQRETAAGDEISPHALIPLRSSRTAGALGPLFSRLGEMHVVQVGAGGGGQELARQLIAIGVRHLTLIDGDILAEENLDRLPHASPSQVGLSKVLQLARSLNANQPEATITIHPESVVSSRVSQYLRSIRADVIFSYVDSEVARLAVSLNAREMETLHIDIGSTVQWQDGQRRMASDIRLFEPGLGCVACVPELEDLEQVLYHLSAPENTLERGRRVTWDQERAGSLLHLNAFTASVAVEHWLRWISGDIQSSRWTRVRWHGLLPKVQSATVWPTEQCRFCNPAGE